MITFLYTFFSQLHKHNTTFLSHVKYDFKMYYIDNYLIYTDKSVLCRLGLGFPFMYLHLYKT